ncbi:MAG TPA: HAD-IIIA family hydrolase [Longimicrobiales bacterium]
MKRAVFLDRDGTIIDEAHYLADPERVRLIPGAAEALAALHEAGFALVVVTNQSGIARGLYTDADFRAVQERLDTLLAERGVKLDLVLYCPHHPDFTGPCECRKPGLGMYHTAAAALGVDLAASVYVGDRVKDVLPALATGGRGYLVRTGYGAAESRDAPPGVGVVDDLAGLARALTGR